MIAEVIFVILISLTALVVGVWYIMELRQTCRSITTQHRQEFVKKHLNVLGVRDKENR